jgi:hypothetical protein
MMTVKNENSVAQVRKQIYIFYPAENVICQSTGMVGSVRIEQKF